MGKAKKQSNRAHTITTPAKDLAYWEAVRALKRGDPPDYVLDRLRYRYCTIPTEYAEPAENGNAKHQ